MIRRVVDAAAVRRAESGQPLHRGPLAKKARHRVAVGAGAVLLVVLVRAGFTSVDADATCARLQFGRVVGVDGPGLHAHLPFVVRLNCLRTSTVFYEVLDDPARSEADFTSGPLDGVTSDGQPVSITFSARYRIEPQQAGAIYAGVGRTMGDIQERVAKFHTRTLTRQYVQRYRADQLYSGELSRISSEIKAALKPRFERSNIVLEEFELKRPRFSQAYESAVESKQLAYEQIQAEHNATRVARESALKQAEVAKGDAEAARIKAESEAVIARARADADVATARTKAIADQEIGGSQAKSDAANTVVRAHAEAEALALRGAVVHDHPELISLQYIEALKTINWAILDSSQVQNLLQLPAPNPVKR